MSNPPPSPPPPPPHSGCWRRVRIVESDSQHAATPSPPPPPDNPPRDSATFRGSRDFHIHLISQIRAAAIDNFAINDGDRTAASAYVQSLRRLPSHVQGEVGAIGGEAGLTKEVISRLLETTAGDKPTVESDGDMCVVCYDDLYGQEEGDERKLVGILSCGHRFHADCIGKWLLRQNLCPVCKSVGIKI